MAIKEGFISNILRMSKRILMKFEQIFKARSCMEYRKKMYKLRFIFIIKE